MLASGELAPERSISAWPPIVLVVSDILIPKRADPVIALLLGFGRSAPFGQGLGVALQQSRNHPEIVRQHAPGNLALLIPMPLAQQRTAQESVLENGD